MPVAPSLSSTGLVTGRQVGWYPVSRVEVEGLGHHVGSVLGVGSGGGGLLMSPEVKPGAGTWGARGLASDLVSPLLDGAGGV